MTDAKDFHYNVDILARTLYGECEPMNVREANAIASVVMNRVHNPKWGGRDVAEVCLQPLQFSCWNSNDPNRSRIMKASDTWFSQCRMIAERTISGFGIDVTCGATHYFLDKIKVPSWAKGHKPCYSIKHNNGTSHLFFNDIDTLPPNMCATSALNQDRPFASTRTVQAGTIAAGSGLVSVAADLTDVQEKLAPLAWYNQHLQTILVVLTLAGIGIMLWARYDDRRKGLR